MLLSGSLANPALAADPENCLLCHRYRGLSRIDQDSREVRLYYVDPNYCDRALGPHARLKCTDCHEHQEVGTIPHLEVSPVDCTRACHLSSPTEVEVVFSHESVAASLNASVHKPAALDESNALLGSPLRPGQSTCLLCHDEPTFRRAGHNWVEEQAQIGRCSVCHTDQLPADARYYYWHVNARSRPAQSSRGLTRLCASCHSHPAIMTRFDQSDASASYLASFHGKAMQLGSRTTASCLDCHAPQWVDVHVMKSHKEPDSPTNPDHLPDTCRSPACHPTAGYAISTAAIHLDLAKTRGIEYFIAAVFVLLILFTFGPSVLLQILELLQLLAGRHDPDHHRHRELADKLMADPRGRQALCRFTPHQRVQHWFLFATFTALVVTGFPIKFADRPWAAGLIGLMKSLTIARTLHRWAGALLLAGLVYHLVYVFHHTWRQRRQKGQGFIRAFLDLPMVMRWEDVRQLGQLLGYLLFLRRKRPDGGRFGPKEKFEYFGVFWGSVLLGITGVLMWAHVWTSAHLTGRVLTVAALIHTFEAFLALLHVGVIHMIGVFFAPSVLPVSLAMVTGDTPAEELAEAHAGMLTHVEQQLKTAPPKEVGRG